MFVIKLLTVCLRLFDTFFWWCVNTCNNVNYMYKTECILVGSHNCSLNCVWHYNSKYWIGILPLVLWSPYPWYYDPLPMVYRTPYPWYIQLPTHGMLTPFPLYFDTLSMTIWTPYPWYFELPTHRMLTPYPWHMNPLSMIFWTRYPWYFDPYPWYFYLSFHGISLHNLW